MHSNFGIEKGMVKLEKEDDFKVSLSYYFSGLVWTGIICPIVFISTDIIIGGIIGGALSIFVWFMLKFLIFPRTPVSAEYKITKESVVEMNYWGKDLKKFPMVSAKYVYLYRPKMRIIDYVVLSERPLQRKEMRKVYKEQFCVFIPRIDGLNEKWKDKISAAVRL